MRPVRHKAEKLSISMSAADARWIRARARRSRKTVSAVLSEAARLLRQQEARHELLRELGDAASATAEEMAAIEAEWRD